MTPTSLDPLPDAHRTSANRSNSKFLEWRAMTAHHTKATMLQWLESNEINSNVVLGATQSLKI